MKDVLYVEDSAIAQVFMRKCLSSSCALTFASTLSKGFEAFQSRVFDLIIADFLFPDGDALDFIKYVRKQTPWDKLPLIVVSSSMDRALMSRVLRAGANDAFAKPFTADDLRGTIKRMFNSPYVRELDEVVHSVSCFQWKAEDGIYQYCPELQCCISGKTKSEVAQKMKALLQEHFEKGVELGATTHESIVAHTVRGLSATRAN